MLNLVVIFFLGYAAGYIFGQSSIKDNLKKKGVDPRLGDSSTSLLNKIVSYFMDKRSQEKNSEDIYNKVNKK